MAAAIPLLDAQTSDMESSPLSYRLAGLAFAAVLPAIFWVVLAVVLGRMAGMAFAASPLALAGTAIALFLGTVCAPIVLKA